MTRLEQETIDPFRGQIGGPVFEPVDPLNNQARQRTIGRRTCPESMQRTGLLVGSCYPVMVGYIEFSTVILRLTF